MLRFLRTVVVLLGAPIVGGAAIFLVALSQLGYHPSQPVTAVERAAARFENPHYFTSSDLGWAAAIGVVGCLLTYGLAAAFWFTSDREELRREVDELFAVFFVRVAGVAVAGGLFGAAFFAAGDVLIMSPGARSNTEELLALAAGSAILTLLVHLPVEGVLWLFSRGRQSGA